MKPETKYIQYLLIAFAVLQFVACTPVPRNAVKTGSYPKIFPDYKEVTIPNNIAPLNFSVEEDYKAVHVVISATYETLTLKGKTKIEIPLKAWKNLLQKSKGDSILITVSTLGEKQWKQFKSFPIYISSEEIDPWIAYRLIAPGYENWSKMGIYQRNLTNFKQKAIVENTLSPGSCVNCHSFKQGNAGNMMFHMRGANGGTFLLQDEILQRINTKSEHTISNCIYPYWHPSGKYIAFSVNRISQAFHAIRDKRIEVIDSESDVVIYNTSDNNLIISDVLMSPDRFETFPNFTPDGRQLIFCSSKAQKIPEGYKRVRYSLQSVNFDEKTGTVDTLINTLVNADSIGKTCTFPRVSPDGRFLMFTMADYGNFTIWHNEADLYLYSFDTGNIRPLSKLNSNFTESYHSWSSSGRWVIFSSRRLDGLYTRPYIAFIDKNGNTGKPFLLPQKDPENHYTFLLESYNVPEFVKDEVSLKASQIEKLIREGDSKIVETFEYYD